MMTSGVHRRLIAAAIGSFLFGAMTGVVPALAQGGDPEVGAATWQSGPCKDCHGWAGDGFPENPQMEGKNLRESTLNPEQMVEVIRCGIPGTIMPSWRNNAWTEIIPCFGMTAPMAGMEPVKGARTFGDRTINGLVAFIQRDFVGQGPVTKEYCMQVLGADSDRCSAYPTAAEAH